MTERRPVRDVVTEARTAQKVLWQAAARLRVCTDQLEAALNAVQTPGHVERPAGP